MPPRTRRTGPRRVIPPRPLRPSPRRIPLPPRKEPLPPADLERVIEEACRFIEERKRAHAEKYRWEIGEHLFLGLYEGDEDYLRRKDPRKTDSLRDVAARTDSSYAQLYTWVVAAVMRRRLAALGCSPDLELVHFKVLYALRDHMEAAVALADLAEARGWSVRDLQGPARFWRNHLDEGGTLDDLKRRPLAPRRPSRRRRVATHPTLMRARRILTVAGKWWEVSSISPERAKALGDRLMAIRALLDPGGGG